MPMIEGIGDEVTQFFIAMVCLVVALLAWRSTGPRADRAERSRMFLIMERNVPVRLAGTTATAHAPMRIRIRRRLFGSETINQQQNSSSGEPMVQGASLSAVTSVDSITSQTNFPGLDEAPLQPQTASDQAPVESELDPAQASLGPQPSPAVLDQVQEMDSIVNAMDTEANILRNRRMTYINGTENPSSDDTPPLSAVNLTPSTRTGLNLPSNLPKIIVRHTADAPMEVTDNSEGSQNATNEMAESENFQSQRSSDANADVTQGNIRIKLKYLNDDLKLVEGSLNEPLGEFKKRHFVSELSARQLVRLIFKGRVLARESDTLHACGLYDNCVVHCLVNQPRPQQNREQSEPALGSLGNLGNFGYNLGLGGPIPSAPDVVIEDMREWDLEHVLFTLVSVALTIAWYCQCRYSSLFDATSSTALLCLTLLYGLALLTTYFPQHVLRHPRAPNHPIHVD